LYFEGGQRIFVGTYRQEPGARSSFILEGLAHLRPVDHVDFLELLSSLPTIPFTLEARAPA
jgi:hypothetical protein